MKGKSGAVGIVIFYMYHTWYDSLFAYFTSYGIVFLAQLAFFSFVV